MKAMKKIALVLALVIIVGMAAIPVAAATETWRQATLHNMAEQARALGFSEDSTIIRVLKDYYAAEGGRDMSGCSYYSSSDGRIHALYDAATWWADGTYGYGYGYGYGNTQVNFYNGVLKDTGITGAAPIVLARLITSTSRNIASETVEAAIVWLALDNCGGEVDERTIARLFPWYSSTSPTVDSYGRDMEALSKDVLYRYRTEQSGVNTAVGRVLPKGWNWLYKYDDGRVGFRQSAGGADYTFPEAWLAYGTYRTPYST